MTTTYVLIQLLYFVEKRATRSSVANVSLMLYFFFSFSFARYTSRWKYSVANAGNRTCDSVDFFPRRVSDTVSIRAPFQLDVSIRRDDIVAFTASTRFPYVDVVIIVNARTACFSFSCVADRRRDRAGDRD